MSKYSIWVLEYCYIAEHPKSAVMYGHHNQGTIKLPFSYILIKGEGTVAMVDVGHNNIEHGEVLTEEYNIQNWQPPVTVLAECGVSPADVEHVFITHAHFDHMGGIALFPNATFYIQEQELAKWIWALSLDSQFRWLLGALDPSDIIRAVELTKQGRLVCVQGDTESIIPYIDLKLAADSHTAGSQYVVVRNDGKYDSEDTWILAGDLIYQFDNLDGGNIKDPYYHPIGLANGSQTNLIIAMHDMVECVQGDRRRVVPGHEQHLSDRYPTRISSHGLSITEIALADGESSKVTNG